MYGSHLSIAGGLHKALTAAHDLNMSCVQVFTASPRNPYGTKRATADDSSLQQEKISTKNQQQWNVKPLEAPAIATWLQTHKRLTFGPVVSHASYLINLASPDDALWMKSIVLFVEEVRRCDLLGIPFLVTHPGAHTGSGEAAGVKRVAAALDEVHKALPTSKTVTCLESTAGQGSCLGHRLEHLADIIAATETPARLGVCLDTAHLFAAGYDFRGRKYASFRKGLDATVGIDRVKVWHLNDSKKGLGSRVDRHEHIGHGEIGLDGFRPIVRDKAWKTTPKILETAKDPHADGRPWDAVNLETLIGLEAK